MTPTTYWITRRDDFLSAYSEPPRPRKSGFYGEARTCVGDVVSKHYQFVGLPHEPAPGECWRVDWIEAKVTIPPTRGTVTKLVPIARNVTAELKEKADG